MKKFNSYTILLYYYYVSILDPVSVVEEHLAYCQSLGLRGRVYIAPEGINGTVSGTTEQVDTYINYMQAHPCFPGWCSRLMKPWNMRLIKCTFKLWWCHQK